MNLGLEASRSNLKTVYSDNAIATYRNPQNSIAPNDYVFSPGVDYAEHQNIVNQTMDAYLVYEKKYSDFYLISLFKEDTLIRTLKMTDTKIITDMMMQQG